MRVRHRSNLQYRIAAWCWRRARIVFGSYALDAGARIGRQERLHVAPIVGGPIDEPKCNFGTLIFVNSDPFSFAKLPWRFPVSFAKRIIEPANTAEPGGMRNICDGQVRVIP